MKKEKLRKRRESLFAGDTLEEITSKSRPTIETSRGSHERLERRTAAKRTDAESSLYADEPASEVQNTLMASRGAAAGAERSVRIPIRRPSQRPGTVAKELAAAKAASPGTTLDGKDEAPPPPPPGPPPDVPRTTVPVQRRNMQTLLGESPHKDDTEEAKYRV